MKTYGTLLVVITVLAICVLVSEKSSIEQLLNNLSWKKITENVRSGHVCERARRSNPKESPCPYYMQMNFTAGIFPFFRAELRCDLQKKQSCQSYCFEKQFVPRAEARLKLIGYRIENGTEVHYFQHVEEKISVACLCA